MKKSFLLIMPIFLLIIHGCKNDPCKGIVTYPKLDPRIPNYFYKVGSYWVYRDSVDGITDSQYVYSYQYRVHYRDPIDTPDKYYQPVGHGPGHSYDYCGPYYLDDMKMHLQSFENGILKDTFTFDALGTGNITAGVNIYEHDTPSLSITSVTGFFLGWPRLGFLDCCYSSKQNGSSYDTTASWYNGVQPAVVSGPYTFTNVAVWGIQIGDGSSTFFAYHTDLYITSGSGIIKIIQHLPTRDVTWDLINYHIVN
jgi:hypothetical protein